MEGCECGGQCGCECEGNECEMNMEECGCGTLTRKYYTKEEKIKHLREYKEDLEKEAKGVAERIKELEKEK
jgi:hypothetical protein